jgi:hypothetical protein
LPRWFSSPQLPRRSSSTTVSPADSATATTTGYEPRSFSVRQAWLDAITQHIQANGIGPDDLLFPTKAGTPISRNTFRTRIWLPAVKASGIDFPAG